MAFRRRFEWGLAWRAGLLLATLALLLEALATPGLLIARAAAAALAGLALASLWTHVRRTNFEVARFVEALRFEDYSQRFASGSGGGFDVLGTALDGAMRSLRMRRAEQAEEVRFLSAIVDDAPASLLTIGDDGAVQLLNKAARRLFAGTPVTRVEDFAAYGAELAAAVALPPGGRRLTRVVLDGAAQRVILVTARVERLGTGLTVASILPVQAEFGRVEMATQADLVRVLTHEIMNSLTPVTSLARSSAELVAAAAARDPELELARHAVETLAARTDGVLRFVESYRDFAFSPELRRRRFAAGDWAEEVRAIAAADPRVASAQVAVVVEPSTATIDGDPDLLAQVAINLLRNAALAGARRAELRIAAQSGGRTAIEVADDGPGIAPEAREDVFLPFYSTRKDGSGIGLSFARQVVLAHDGMIAADAADLGGASIRILL
jgi:two-component system, NtrC family, nitrogen regulation sensor histidine kinase NtrY